MSRAWATRATAFPMCPAPMMPRVFPLTSTWLQERDWVKQLRSPRSSMAICCRREEASPKRSRMAVWATLWVL